MIGPVRVEEDKLTFLNQSNCARPRFRMSAPIGSVTWREQTEKRGRVACASNLPLLRRYFLSYFRWLMLVSEMSEVVTFEERPNPDSVFDSARCGIECQDGKSFNYSRFVGYKLMVANSSGEL